MPNEREGTERLLTVAEAAERLGVCEKTVRREIAAGSLGVVRLGPARRRIGVPETALRAYLRERWA